MIKQVWPSKFLVTEEQKLIKPLEMDRQRYVSRYIALSLLCAALRNDCRDVPAVRRSAIHHTPERSRKKGSREDVTSVSVIKRMTSRRKGESEFSAAREAACEGTSPTAHSRKSPLKAIFELLWTIVRLETIGVELTAGFASCHQLEGSCSFLLQTVVLAAYRICPATVPYLSLIDYT